MPNGFIPNRFALWSTLRREAADPPPYSPWSAENRSSPTALPGGCLRTHLRDADLQHGPLSSQARLLREPKTLGPDHMPSEATLGRRGVGGPRAGREQGRAPGRQAAKLHARVLSDRLRPSPRRHVGSLLPDGKRG